MVVEVFPKKKNCVLCGKSVRGFFSYYSHTWDYKTVWNKSEQGIEFRIYSEPYHFKCAEKLLK